MARWARSPSAGLASDIVYSIAGDGADSGSGRQRGGLTHIRTAGSSVDGRELHAGRRPGAEQRLCGACVRAMAPSGPARSARGVSRLPSARFTTWTTADGLASNTVAAMLESADGTMWFGTPNGAERANRAAGWRRYATRGRPAVERRQRAVRGFDRRVWVGTSLGLAVIQRRPRATRDRAGVRAARADLGHGRGRAAGLWVATGRRLLRVNRARLAAGAALTEGDLHEYGVADGLISTEGVKRHRSVVADPRGRVWFATRQGLSVADVARAVGGASPALAHIERLAADGTRDRFLAAGAGLRRAQRITVTFAGLSLAAPERVRYRYRLDGFDRGWSEPRRPRVRRCTPISRLARTCFGSPHRTVTAMARRRGESALRRRARAGGRRRGFGSRPLRWSLFAGWALYRLRLMQVASRLHLRFEERLAERTRIAQELHDTLLQGFVSASMQLHVAADRVPHDSPAKASLGHVLALMGQVIEEGRNAVHGLRSSMPPAATIWNRRSAVSRRAGRRGARRVPGASSRASRARSIR